MPMQPSVQSVSRYVTDHEAETYFTLIIKHAPHTIQKLFFRCLRVARRLAQTFKLDYVYRFIFNKFEAWVRTHEDGTFESFLESCSLRDIFEGASYSYAERKDHYARVFQTTLH
jgi:hypothetical protein